MKYLATNEEILEFNKIPDEKKAINFIYTFWNKRNPSPLLKTNPRILEHYKRILYAEKNYRYDKERHSFINNMDSYLLNNEFTDQGFIYIRHGKPDDKSMSSYSKITVGGWAASPKGRAERDLQDEMLNNYDEFSAQETILSKGKLSNTKAMDYPLCETWLYKETKENAKMIFFYRW